MERYDLLQLQRGSLALLGQRMLQSDVYRAVRVTIDCDSSIVTFSDGARANIRWPHGGALSIYARVPAPIVIPDSGVSLVIDIDVGRSFISGLDDPLFDFLFTPSMRAVDAAATGSISGTIMGDVDGAPEAVQGASMTVLRCFAESGPDPCSRMATGYTDSSGYYKVGFLLPGAYSLRVETPTPEVFGTLYAHDIEVVAGEDFLFSVTLPSGSATGAFPRR
jgi:hypothetical protein